jgi:ribosomal protein L32
MIKRKRKMNTKVTVLAEEEEGVGEKKRFHRITIACFFLRRNKKNCGIKK